MKRIKETWYISLVALLLSGAFCGCGPSNSTHTTALTHISPPPRQILNVVSRPVPVTETAQPLVDKTGDPTRPLLVFYLKSGSTFHVGEEVPMSLEVRNAKLKGDGGEFRIRYIVDDDDMQWRDTDAAFWLAGWTPGKHTIRVELIGPDGWPYQNGNANTVTREITIQP